MFDQLKQTLGGIVAIPDKQMEAFAKIAKPRDYKAGECFITENEIPNKFAFNVNGLFRYYYADQDGNEYTKGFFPENTFISSYSAMVQKRESYFRIEALENSSVLIVNYLEFMKLFSEHECWKLFLIKILELGYFIKETREREFLLFDAMTRYKSFLSAYPGLEKRVKQHLIASYIGITPVALSRIRNKMKT
ncbi:Crp/Fnr family transcriptional regulator [Leptospira sp. 96542]|nr:Crp/Fnr family transcriptional regulator [Leptospira sp. 96542]